MLKCCYRLKEVSVASRELVCPSSGRPTLNLETTTSIGNTNLHGCRVETAREMPALPVPQLPEPSLKQRVRMRTRRRRMGSKIGTQRSKWMRIREGEENEEETVGG